MARPQKKIKIEQCLEVLNDGENDDTTKSHNYNYETDKKVIKTVTHRFRYKSNIRINQDMKNPKVNFVEFGEDIDWFNSKEQHNKCHFP